MNFNPFEDRLSRDTRNALGHGFIQSIRSNSMDPFLETKAAWTAAPATPEIQSYIKKRRTHLTTILNQLAESQDFEGQHSIPVILWNLQLFFEFHEWMEEIWTSQTKAQKKASQALIIAAVVYEHLTYHRTESAKRLAKKAVNLFEAYGGSVPDWADPPIFCRHLTNLNLAPPVLELIQPENKRSIP